MGRDKERAREREREREVNNVKNILVVGFTHKSVSVKL